MLHSLSRRMFIAIQPLAAVVQMHIVKNFIADQLSGVNPPLVLGIWGPKGCGKTFQTELAFKKLKYAVH